MTLVTPTKHRLSMPTTLETKVVNSKEGRVQAIVSASGNRDSDGDVVLAGASKWGLDQLADMNLMPKGVWSHDWSTPIAKTLHAVEVYPGDKSLPEHLGDLGLGGLRVDAQFNLGTTAGKDAFNNVEFFEDQQQYSVGYEIPGDGWFIGGGGRDNGEAAMVLGEMTRHGSHVVASVKALLEDDRPSRFITKWITWEWSPVLFGANLMGSTESTKAAQTVPTLERIVVRLDAIESKLDGHRAPGSKEVTMFDQRIIDVEESLAHLTADFAGKAGRVQARRNEERLRAMRDAVQSMLDELGADDDEGKSGKHLTVNGVKVWMQAPMEGSVEETQQALAEAVSDAFPAPDGDNPWWVSVVATYDTWVLVSVDDYDNDPPDYFVFPYVLVDDDTVTLGPATPVEVGMVIEGPEGNEPDPDDPVPTTGLSAVLPAQVATTGEAGYKPIGRKNHDFQPSEDNAAECAECGAGASRPWHNDDKGDHLHGGDDQDEDEKRRNLAFEMDVIRFATEKGRMSV